MKTFINSGKTIEYVAGGTVTAGSIVSVNGVLGVAANSGGSGDTIQVDTEGVYYLPQASAGAVSQGAKMYYDLAGHVTNTQSTTTYPMIGRCYIAAGSSDVNVAVKLNVP